MWTPAFVMASAGLFGGDGLLGPPKRNAESVFSGAIVGPGLEPRSPRLMMRMMVLVVVQEK
ncbi:hypothetical protein Mapa_010026 [Marchantia paleacea]|nr:hypothetical protein Mapa_010026 [Marchantia paleacea]